MDDFPSDDWPNDDPNEIGEDNLPDQGDRLYALDRPGLWWPEATRDQLVARANFREFVRVRFDGRPFGHPSSEGSRCSERVAWRAFLWLERDPGSAWWRERQGRANEVVERHAPLLPPPTP